MLVVFAVYMATTRSGSQGATSLSASFDTADQLQALDDTAIRIDPRMTDSAETDALRSSPPSPGELLPPAEPNIVPPLVGEPVALDTSRAFDRLLNEDLFRPTPPPTISPTVDTKRLREADSVERAAGGIIGDILSRLAEGDLLVVWMFDQSISLVDDRQRIAVHLASLFDQTKAQSSSKGHTLTSAAVAFGADVVKLVPPTDSSDRIIKAVREVPVDDSGLERVFSAVGWAVKMYSRAWDKRMMIVVWTDESGDDVDALESTIETCRNHAASASIVGPSAILGRQAGTHAWTYAPTGKVFLLPVMRGPDSALAERLRLPYWYKTTFPAAGSTPQGPEAQAAADLPWYGGEQLEGMVSGLGPYALSRLALETGGTYTIFDRPADRGPFRLDVMRPYAPDYRALKQILADLRYHPLRQAVINTADFLARQSGINQPAMDFFGRRYQTPTQFRRNLKEALTRERLAAAQNLQLIETALGQFGPQGMDEAYEKEESPRYRAWYDLTRGRLLAVGARYLEYSHACQLAARSLNPNTNRLTFSPSKDLRGGSATESLANEAQRLLQRCMRQNPETPWALLAQRELDYSPGFRIEQSVIPAPPPKTPKPGAPAAPAGRAAPARPRAPAGARPQPIPLPKL